jgi:hypothetical protein
MAGAKPPSVDPVFTPSKSGYGATRPRPKPQTQAAKDADPLEPAQEPQPKQKPVFRLSNGKWLEPRGQYGKPIEASVDVDIPAGIAATRVLFTLYELLPDGKRVERARDEKAHARDGQAVSSLTLPEPASEAGQVPARAYFQFTAKHAYSEEHQGPRLEAVPGPPGTGFESVLYYSPQRGEYLHFESEEEFGGLDAELERLKGLRGKTRAALSAPDESARRQSLERIAKEAEALFEGEIVGDAEGVLEELLLVRQNPRWGKAKSWIYIQSHVRRKGGRVKGHWRKETDRKIKENLDDLLKKAPGNPEASPLLTGDISQKLFEMEPKAGQPLKWYRQEKRGELAGKAFQFTKEAAVVRFAYGFEGDVTGNWKERKLRLGTSGHLTFGLLEGRMQGEIPCPEDGVNLLEYLREVKGLHQFLKEGRHCLLRVKVTLGAKAFAGLSLQAALSLPHIDLSKEKPGRKEERRAEVGGEGAVMLGIQGSESLEVAPEWSQTNYPPKFESLGLAKAEIGVTVGLAGEARCRIEYANGRFRIKLGAGAALGIGPRGGLQFDVSLEEGWKLIGHLFNSVDYRYVAEVSTEAFEAYKNYSFTLMTEGKAALVDGVALAVEVVGDFKTWLIRTGDQLRKFKHSLTESSYYGATLGKVPPEALGQALITIMQSRHEKDFDAIYWILCSTVRRGSTPHNSPSADHKLKWTLRAASGIIFPRAIHPEHEIKKEEALRKGIQAIQEFGMAGGHWAQDRSQRINREFLIKFNRLLCEQGISP